MATECKHRIKVRTRDTRCTSDYLCVRCQFQWKTLRIDKVPKAPKRWAAMDQGELAVWYVRTVWKAMI